MCSRSSDLNFRLRAAKSSMVQNETLNSEASNPLHIENTPSEYLNQAVQSLSGIPNDQPVFVWSEIRSLNLKLNNTVKSEISIGQKHKIHVQGRS